MEFFRIWADAIFHISRGQSLLYLSNTPAFSASESEDILNGFLKDASLSASLDFDICISRDEFFWIGKCAGF